MRKKKLKTWAFQIFCLLVEDIPTIEILSIIQYKSKHQQHT